MFNRKNIAVIIVVIFLLGTGFYLWQKPKIQNSDPQSQLRTSPISDSQPQPISEDQLVWYEIPELGIKFPVDKEVKDDLIYSFNESLKDKIKSAAFSLKSISKKIDYDGRLCSADRGPLGGIIRIEGKFEEGGRIRPASLVKQFDDFFLLFPGLQAPSGCFKGRPEENYLDINKYIPLSKIEEIN